MEHLDESSQMGRIKKVSGIIGLVVMLLWVGKILIDLSVVFILPPIPGYTEDVVATSAYHGVLLWPGVFLFLLIVFMMFYPWLKLFVSLSLGKARTDYYGLFLSYSKSSKVVASVLTAISALSIIQLSVYAIGQAAVIREWNYDYVHCPDLCIEITAFLFLSLAFWSVVYLFYYFYGHYHSVA